jgi:excisionase family DNA binding protein
MKNQLHEDETLLTRRETAEHRNVTLRFVTRYVQEGRIQYMRVGRMVDIPATAIAEYVSSNTVPSLDRRNLR